MLARQSANAMRPWRSRNMHETSTFSTRTFDVNFPLPLGRPRQLPTSLASQIPRLGPLCAISNRGMRDGEQTHANVMMTGTMFTIQHRSAESEDQRMAIVTQSK